MLKLKNILDYFARVLVIYNKQKKREYKVISKRETLKKNIHLSQSSSCS